MCCATMQSTMAAIVFHLALLFPLILANETPTSTLPPILINTALTARATPDLSPQYTDDLTFRTSMLNSTNFFRYAHSAPFLYWNRTLASDSHSYTKKCQFKHSGGRTYGENIAEGYADVTAAVNGWGDEGKDYKFSENEPTGFSSKTGHFTQLVWKSTTSVGCGWTDCTDQNGMFGVYLVCRYDPAGNVVGNDNEFFKQNVAQERDGGEDGFEDVEMQATVGADGSPPTGTGRGSASATGKSGASDWMKADGSVLALVVLLFSVVVGFVLFV